MKTLSHSPSRRRGVRPSRRGDGHAGPGRNAQRLRGKHPQQRHRPRDNRPWLGREHRGGTPKTGGTLTFGTSADWAGIDPQLVASGVAQVVFNQIFEGLVTRDRTINTDSPPIKPGLAQSWATSPDRRTYTFQLRPNVTFQDGTPFDANAVQFNFRRWRDPSFPYYSAIAAGNTVALMQEVASTSAVGPMTFAITLKAPDAGLIDRMSGSSFYYMVSPAAVQKYGNTGFGQHGIGTGPFMVKSFQQGQRLVLLRNPTYWGTKPYLDSIVFQPIPDAGARVAAVMSGEVDVAMEIHPTRSRRSTPAGPPRATARQAGDVHHHAQHARSAVQQPARAASRQPRDQPAGHRH